jgi:tetratricopeptide (TPR) repeat protein
MDINDITNREGTTLLWFDPKIGSREDTEHTKQCLRHINDYVKFHKDLEQCVTFIQSREKEKIFLITSGSKASQILSRVSSLRQVDCIFIYCMIKERYEHLINEYSKIIGIYVNLDELSQSIKEQIDLVDKQLQTFSVFDQHQKSTKDLTKESGAFLWFQLFNYVIARLPRNQQAKQQMIDMCKHYYRGNSKELKLIDQFEREYRSDEAILWYSKQSFVYKLINQALRTEDMDLLYRFRFFISDLSGSLAHEQEKILSSDEEMLTVYRGAKLDQEEFDKLKENQGKLISTNGYLSTSRVRERSLRFATKPTKRTNFVPVLFQIDCEIKLIGTSIAFADVACYSQYPQEEEVLFDLNACFRIESIEQDGSLQLIKMHVSKEGETITKDYVAETQNETEKTSVAIVFGRLMCKLGQYNKSQKYFEELLKDPNGEDVAWIEFNIGLAFLFKSEWEEARKYYDRAYDRMMNATPARIKDSAHVLNNISVILCHQKKYDEALNYHQQALAIRKEHYPSGRGDIATSLNNIGNIFSHQGKYDEALDYHHQSLKMREKYYPSGHVDIGYSLNNIGACYEMQMQKNKEMALGCYQQALAIYENFLPEGNLSRVGIARNIRQLTEKKINT